MYNDLFKLKLEALLQLWEALTFFIFKSMANGLQILILMSGKIAQSYVCPLLSNQHSTQNSIPHKMDHQVDYGEV